MIKKGSPLYSIVKMKCPHCHEGDFFKSSIYNLKDVGKIHDNCPVCKELYSIEPGFYYGAMYVSYGLGVGIFIAVFVLVYLLFPNPTMATYITVILIAIVVSAPLLYALSKIIWANMFMNYKEKINENENN